MQKTLLEVSVEILNKVADMNPERVMALLPKICDGAEVGTGQNWRAAIRWHSEFLEVFDNSGQAADQVYRYIDNELGKAANCGWSPGQPNPTRIDEINRAVDEIENTDYTEILTAVGVGPSFYPADENPWAER